MAGENEIALKLALKVEEAKTVGELKSTIKEIKNELLNVEAGSSAFVTLQKAAGKAKGELGEINEQIAALDTENKTGAFLKLGAGIAGGFEAAQGAMALFGAESENIEKQLLKVQAASAFANGIKEASEFGKTLKNVGTIIKANPLLLLATVLIGIGTALFALRDKIKIVGEAFDFIGNVVDNVIEKGKEFLNFIGILDETSEKLEEQNKRFDELAKTTEKKYENEIRLAKAAGQETEGIEKKKILAMQSTLLVRIKNLEALEKEGKLNEEQAEQLEKLREQYNENRVAYQELILSNLKADEDAKKKKEEEAKKKAEEERKRREEEAKKSKDWFAKNAEEEAEQIRQFEANKNEIIKESGLEEIDFRFKTQEEIDKQNIEWITLRDKQAEEERQRRIAEEEAIRNAKISIAYDTTDALSSIADIAIQDEKKREAFKKKLALVNIGIDTAVAISSLVRNSEQNPLNGATFGSAGAAQFAAGLARIIANIAKAKALLQSDSGSAPTSGGSGGRSGIPTGTNAPDLAKMAEADTGKTQLGENGQPIVKAVVVETDITNTQNRVKSIQEKATI